MMVDATTWYLQAAQRITLSEVLLLANQKPPTTLNAKQVQSKLLFIEIHRYATGRVLCYSDIFTFVSQSSKAKRRAICTVHPPGWQVLLEVEVDERRSTSCWVS